MSAKILIVDDELSNLQIGISILKEHRDYHLVFATSGEDALKKVENTDFDLILLDIIMQPLDGFEVCTILKQNERTRDIPIIFLTAKADSDSIVKGFEIGGSDYITKPFNAGELLVRVDNHIKLKKYYEDRLADQEALFRESRIASMADLLNNIAHHWRQPLNVIAIQKEVISQNFKEETLTEEMLDSILTGMNDKLQTLSKTIDNFRRYFSSDLQKKKANITDLVKEVLFLFEPKIKDEGINVTCDCSESYCNIYVNEFKQAVANILNNAIDAVNDNKEKDILIKVNASSECVSIDIIDNGCGLEDEGIERAFDPYYTTKFKSYDKGLGLYYSKIVVEEHLGGTITIDHVEGKTKVNIVLTRCDR